MCTYYEGFVLFSAMRSNHQYASCSKNNLIQIKSIQMQFNLIQNIVITTAMLT